MNQKEFTAHVLQKVIAHFPQFENWYTIKENDIVNIEFKSGKGDVELWVTTQDLEITIGLTGLKRSLFDWHMHITPFDFNMVDDYINDAIDVIKNILNDRFNIVDSNRLGYTLNNREYMIQHQEPNEIIKSVRWSEL
jgi:hypothetical protein